MSNCDKITVYLGWARASYNLALVLVKTKESKVLSQLIGEKVQLLKLMKEINEMSNDCEDANFSNI